MKAEKERLTMVNFEKVSFSYKRQTLYQDLNLSFNEGRIIGLLGKNGSGKSTLLSLIAGLNFPQSGTVETLGEISRHRRAGLLSQMFFLPEQYQLPSMKGARYVAMYRDFYPQFNDDQFMDYAKVFELDLNKKLSRLSMGQQKKFLIAFGLACNCSLNLLDEPTNGLDIPSKKQFRKLVRRAMNGYKTFLISTHQVKDIDTLVSQVCIVEQGSVLLNQPTTKIAQTISMSISTDSDETDIYTEDVGLGQVAKVTAKQTLEPSLFDLELLFNATLANPEGIQVAIASGTTTRVEG